MKKLYYLLFLFVIGLLFVPIAFAKDSVEIIAVELDSKSDNTTINSEPTYSGLTMNFDIGFRAKDDYAKYKVTVKNNSNIDYMISEDTPFNASEYVSYTYSTESELKANEETTFYITITYSKEVDDSLLVGTKYTEANNVVVQLKDDNGVIKIPDTAKDMNMKLIIFLGIIFAGTLVALIINNDNYKKIVGVIVLGLLLIPIHALAAEVLKLTVNVNIEINKGFKVAYGLVNVHRNVEDELVGYDISDYECTTVYLGTVQDANKYFICEGIIVDEVSYKEGSIAKVDRIPIKFLSSPDKVNIVGVIDNCEKQADESYLCGESVGTFSLVDNTNDSIWNYSITGSNNYNYPAYEEDTDIMHFSDIFDSTSWQTQKIISVNALSEFTMPKHDVLFILGVALR